MNYKQSILSAAIVASLSFAAQLHAQETAQPAAAAATATTHRRHRPGHGRGDGYPRQHGEIARHQAQCQFTRGSGHRRRRRQAAGPQRGRHPAAPAGREHQLVQRRRRRFRRIRSCQPARHQPQPDPDPDQRPQRRLGRLVRAQPGQQCRPQRQLHPAAVRAGQLGGSEQVLAGQAAGWRHHRHHQHHHPQAAAVRRPVHRRGVGRRSAFRAGREHRPATVGPVQLQE